MDIDDFNVPFQGRKDFLDDLMNAWKDNKVMFVVFGMRSVGKTRTVQKHIHDVKTMISKKNTKFRHVKVVNVDIKFLTKCGDFHPHICTLFGIVPDPGYARQGHLWFRQIEVHIRQSHDYLFFVCFDHYEDVIDLKLDSTFLSFVDTLSRITCNVRVYITSTTQFSFSEINEGYFCKTLEPMNEADSKKLLRTVAKNINFCEYMDKIVELCDGLPLALLMVGSELEADDGLLKPEDMVELLTRCRLQALSREFYPKEDRIADVYKEFIHRLSSIFQQRLATLEYIPGSFTPEQVKGMLGLNSDDGAQDQTFDGAQDQTLKLLTKKHYINYDTVTKRYDIHSILRECLSVYVCIKSIPACRRRNNPKVKKCSTNIQTQSRNPLLKNTRKRFCQTFTETITNISRLMSTADYAKALSLFALEHPNLQKLLTEILNAKEDTYHFSIEVASTCYRLLEEYMPSLGEKFFEGCLKVTSNNGRPQDEAIVNISYGSLLTNAKGDTFGGEALYRQALHVLQNGPNCVKLAEVHQRLGWNLYVQGRADESFRHLKLSFEISESMGNKRTTLCLQSLNSLGVVSAFRGNFDAAEKFYEESLHRHIQNLEEENQERVKQNKRLIYEEELPRFGYIFNNMGNLYLQKGDIKQALYYHEKGLKAKMQSKVPGSALLISLKNVAADYSLSGHHQKALELLKEAESIAFKESLLDQSSLSALNDTMGKVYIQCKRFSKARGYLLKAVKSRESIMNRSPFHAESVLHLCQAEIGLENYNAARHLAEEVVSMKNDITKSMPQNNFVSEALECLIEICFKSKMENLQRIEEIYQALERELKRLILFHEYYHNDEQVRHLKEKLQSVKTKVAEVASQLYLFT